MPDITDDFIKITKADIPLLLKYLKIAQIPESNHNIVNMFLWMDQYPLWQYHTDDYMILLGIHKGHYFAYMPLCEDHYFNEALMKIKELFDKHEIPFELSCFTEDGLEKVRSFIPKLHVQVEGEAADYVYEGEKLATLSGKKLQKRRNNYNYFVREYEGRFEYSDLMKEDIPELIDFVREWRKGTKEEYLYYELEGLHNLFDLFGVLPYSGAIIRIDGEIKAFIIVSQSREDMIQINVEKADPSIRGLYQAIEKLFIQKHFPNIPWVNREDDMGIESLRAAKRALNPAYMIEKYRIRSEDESTSGEEE